ncbi:hypothetical protein D3C75_741580 [compost metagenome]
MVATLFVYSICREVIWTVWNDVRDFQRSGNIVIVECTHDNSVTDLVTCVQFSVCCWVGSVVCRVYRTLAVQHRLVVHGDYDSVVSALIIAATYRWSRDVPFDSGGVWSCFSERKVNCLAFMFDLKRSVVVWPSLGHKNSHVDCGSIYLKQQKRGVTDYQAPVRPSQSFSAARSRTSSI